MSKATTHVYDQYAWKPEYEELPKTFGGFAIIPGVIEAHPAVCIKQRNGKGSSPYLFDLPGGGAVRMDLDDDFIEPLYAACMREAWEEVRVKCNIKAAIGQPLYLPIRKDGALVKVDYAQAFLVETQDKPSLSEEALAVAFVHQKSFAGFNVVSRKADPASPVFGRTPVMIFDGLSVLQEPFWRGALTESLRAAIIGDPNSDDFLLVDGGNYFGRTFPSIVTTEKSQGTVQIALYRRLNPDQPDGYFHGVLDNLAS